MDYLTVEEVALILKAHTNTIYKMCRQGVLPAVKIGPSWRIDREKLATFMEGGSPPVKTDTFKGLVSLALKKGHYLGLFVQERHILDFELTYFATAMEQGTNNCYMKFCWWQHPDDARRHLSSLSVDVERMESEGSLVILNMSRIFNKSGVDGACESLDNAFNSALKQGYKNLVASGLKHVDCCNKRHLPLLELENGISSLGKKYPVSFLCSYLIDPVVDNFFPRIMDILLLHDQFFIQTMDQEVMAKVSYSRSHHSKS